MPTLADGESTTAAADDATAGGYPADWPAIARAVKERARWRCEGSPAYPDCLAIHGRPHPVTGSLVVLTTAHLDHCKPNCAPDNLRAWCQRCHLAYDLPRHLHNRRHNPARRAGQTSFIPDTAP